MNASSFFSRDDYERLRDIVEREEVEQALKERKNNDR